MIEQGKNSVLAERKYSRDTNGGGCREGIATLKGPAWGGLAGVSEGLGVRGGYLEGASKGGGRGGGYLGGGYLRE